MKCYIYLDIIFIINFIMDFCIIDITYFILKRKVNIIRELLASLLGAIGATCMYMFPLLNGAFKGFVCYVIIAVIMSIVAFSESGIKDYIKTILLIVLVTFILGGVMNFIYYGTPIGAYIRYISGQSNLKRIALIIFFICIFIVALLTRLFVWNLDNVLKKGTNYEVLVYIKDKCIGLRGFMDTGNKLSNPMDGKGIVVIDYKSINCCLPDEYKYLLDEYFEKGYLDYDYMLKHEIGDIRMINYSTVSNSSAKIPCVICDKLVVIYKNQSAISNSVLAALSDSELLGGDYEIILHEDVI